MYGRQYSLNYLALLETLNHAFYHAVTIRERTNFSLQIFAFDAVVLSTKLKLRFSLLPKFVGI